MNVPGIPHLEVCIGSLEVVAALGVIESILNKEVNEDYVCICSNAINFTTFISGLVRGQIFSGCMSDHFLSSCVMLGPSIAVSVSDSSSVMSGFVMIAFSVKGKSADHLPNLIVVNLEIFTSINIAQILSECIAAASDDQIEQI